MDSLIDILKLNILTSLPEVFVCLLFVFSFLQPLPNKLFKRLAIITLIHSAYTDLVVFYIPLHLHLINSFLTFAILIFIFFRELGVKRLIFVYVSNIFLLMITDIILVTIAVYGLGIQNRETILQDNLYQVLTILYPQLLVTLVISWFIRNRNLLSAKRLFSIVMEGDRGTLTRVLSLIILQFVLISTLFFLQTTMDSNKPYTTAIIIYLTILVSLLALISIIRLLIRSREQAIRATQEVYIEDINNMFTSIRGQRHDFLNHVQVIHTMAQMGKMEQLKSYVADLVKESQEVSELVHHDSPALAAFVRAKLTVAVGRGIAFTYELPSEWNVQESSIKIIDIIKIMGNLVDNAFDETEHLPIENRRVHTSVKLEDNTIQITVSNSGRQLDSNERKQILQTGYTTKGQDHSGLGLAIVTERVKHYKGELSVESDKLNGTQFRLSLPHTKNFSI